MNRCKSINKNGIQCGRMVPGQNAVCWQHSKCKAKTTKGRSCSRNSINSTGYCWQHKHKHKHMVLLKFKPTPAHLETKIAEKVESEYFDVDAWVSVPHSNPEVPSQVL